VDTKGKLVKKMNNRSIRWRSIILF
jgi:hypothetical protein